MKIHADDPRRLMLREPRGFPALCCNLIGPLDDGGDILTDGEVICANEAIFEKFAETIRGG